MSSAASDSPAQPSSPAGSLTDCVDASSKLVDIWKRPDRKDSQVSALELPGPSNPPARKGKEKATISLKVVDNKVVLTPQENVWVKRLFAEMLAQKGSAMAGLTAAELEGMILVEEGTEDAPEGPVRAAGDPDELDDDEDELPQQAQKQQQAQAQKQAQKHDQAHDAQQQQQQAHEQAQNPEQASAHSPEQPQQQQHPQQQQQPEQQPKVSVDEDVNPVIAEALAQKKILVDRETARPTELVAEGVRWRHLGRQVGWEEAQEAALAREARVKLGELRGLELHLEPEYQKGRKEGAATYKTLHKRTVKQRVRDAKSLTTYRVGKVKAWLAVRPKEAAKKVWDVTVIVAKWIWENGDKILKSLLAIVFIIGHFLATA
ncbi:hypothetical protein CALCODRAFT_481436 [Calocera cornea HHB12733]|uniref:Uncharacterized protein n=1 Tax=Calocera cornea HHB12733 TaxID=1353952 RepID=A0A165HP23_9BASI|nr:hypothetical protein CALCODRAFT_481436 [Calocera cornea HHB12733]